MAETIPEWAQEFPTNNPLKLTRLVGGVSSSIPLEGQFDKNHIVIGRNPDCDICIDEISCSRKHALICFGNGPPDEAVDCAAYWICDLATQNGSLMNNNLKLEPHKFYLLKNGYFFQFGINEMRYLFEYDNEIQKVDDEETTTKTTPINSAITNTKSPTMTTESYADWGQNYDIEAEKTNMVVNNEPAPEVEDPIRVMKNYFKREGLEFKPEFVKLNVRFLTAFEATLTLPIEDLNNDESNETTLTSQGDNKSEALNRVCKLAYELLFARDLLNKHVEESYKNRKKRELAANDYYDSDDDTFYDRTGSIEHKRERRIKQNESRVNFAASSSNYKSYFDKLSNYVPSKKINSRLNELNKHMIRVKSELQRAKNKKDKLNVIADDDDEAEQQMALSENNQLTADIKQLNDKFKQLIKEREQLLQQFEHSKEVENNPELLESVTHKNINTTQQQIASKQDHIVVEEIIKSYTDPAPIQKLPKLEPLTDNTDIPIKKSSHNTPKIQPTNININTNIDTNNDSVSVTSKYEKTDPTRVRVESDKEQIDPRDMIESDKEQMIDDSPISWIPQSDNATKHLDDLKNKYGY